MGTTQGFGRPTHHSRPSFASSIASTSSGTELPYAHSCLEYGLEIITRALTEQDLDSPRSSLYSSHTPQHTDHQGARDPYRQRVGRRGEDGEGSVRSSVRSRRLNPGTHTPRSSGGGAWHAHSGSSSSRQREEWRRGTIFLDEIEQFGESSRRASERSSGSNGWTHPYATSTDHSSDDGRNDENWPLTPPESTADDSDGEERGWVGRMDRVPEWAAPDIVDCYRNGWSDDRKHGPTSEAGSTTRKGGEDAASDYSWRKDAEDGDDHSQSELHFPSSGRSVLPAGRLLLNTLSEEGPASSDTSSSYAPSQRPGTSDGDARWRDNGSGWFDSFHQSQSVTSFADRYAPNQLEEDAKASRPGPRLRGMRSMLLTRPVAPRPSTSERRDLPGGLREFARAASASPSIGRPETASPTRPARPVIHTEIRHPSVSFAKTIPAVQSTGNLNRRYHYQKSQNLQRVGSFDGDKESSIKSSGWNDERAPTMLRKGKPSPLAMNGLADVNPAWHSAGPMTHSFQLAASKGPRSQFSPPNSPEDATVDAKVTKEKKKRTSRMSAFVGKVFAGQNRSGERAKISMATMYIA